jgi:transposase
MLQFAPGMKVYLALKPVDMRRGFDGLAADVAQVLRNDPFSGAAFVFRSKRGDYVKILTWDGSGLSHYAKRLDRGKFIWPAASAGAVSISAGQMAYMFDHPC